ncbi:hypothetical protein, partial [Microbacterium sp. Bi128]|uniref:hypothetical protein n=1 Tax=Microbacterium sp. Bi128 TaxID=2821115 RepID=UPI001E3F4A64
MRKIYSRAILGALIGGGLVVVGTGMAHAAETSGTDDLLSGDQAIISVDLPVTLGGNAVSLLGDSHSSDATTSVPASQPAPDVTTDGGDGIGSGNQGIVSIDVPVTVGGNAVSVVGDSHTEDAETSAPAPAPAPAEEAAPAADVETDGTDSLGGGNQAVVPISVPVSIGGNAVSVVGDSHSEDAGTTGGAVGGGGAASGGSGDVETDGSDSLLGGNQAVLPISVPVTIGGNAVSVIGDSHTEDAATTGGAASGGSGDVGTDGSDSLGGGNQVIAPISLPVTIGGNAVSGIGDSTSENATTGGAGSGGSAGDVSTDGTDSILGGNQGVLPISLPVTIGGNAVSGIGDSTSENATTTGGTSGGLIGGVTTDGSDSILGGNQLIIPISLPVTIGGNAVSVIGDSTTVGSE